MTLSGYFMPKSVFSQQSCRALTFALVSRYFLCHQLLGISGKKCFH